jgi:hypothetical protein
MKNFLGTVFVLALCGAGVFGAFYQLDPDFRFRLEKHFTATPASPAPLEPKASTAPTRHRTQTQGRWAKIDAHALATGRDKAQDVPSLVRHLCTPAQNDWDKARAIFRWITANISYDDVAYETKQYGSKEPADILKARKGVCEHFSILFKAMAEAAGLKAEKISGYAKGYGYVSGQELEETDHAWNAVFIEGAWRLMDVTWAQGYGENKNGKMASTKRFENAWFDTPPAAFIFKHLPEESRWQLLSKPLTMEEYTRLPVAELELFTMGYDAADALDQVRRDRNFTFPTMYNHPFVLHVIEAPMNGVLAAGQEVTFEFESSDCNAMAIVANEEWIYMDQKGKTFTATFTPEAGTFSLYARRSKKGGEYLGIMKYEVKKMSGTPPKSPA